MRVRALALGAVAAGVALCPAGCGAPDRPPQDGEIASVQPDASTSTTFQPTAPTELSCNLGPDGGVCACADQPLLGEPPNLYFVLDRSGSMSVNNKWLTIVNAVGNLVVQLGPRAAYGATVFPGDPESCGPGAEVFATTRGDAPAGTAGPVEGKLIETLGALSPEGDTPTAVTLTALDAKLKTLPGKTYVILATDGGPNCNASASCGASSCQINIESGLGCSPTGTNCCTESFLAAQGDPQPALDAALNCEDSGPTDAAVKQLAADGFPVYVMGIPGSAPYADLLNQLARDGNTARSRATAGADAGSGDDGGGDASAGDAAASSNTPAPATDYYAVDSPDLGSFTAAMSAIAASITATCTLTLNNAPPDPAMVNVFVDEKVLPQQGDSGWTLSGQTVTILGKTCSEILSGQALDVRVVAGCPTLQR